jgi:hypothetical protein
MDEESNAFNAAPEAGRTRGKLLPMSEFKFGGDYYSYCVCPICKKLGGEHHDYCVGIFRQ